MAESEIQNVLGQFPSMEKQENVRIWQQYIDRESDRKLNISEPCRGQSCSTISLAPLPHGSLREVATPIHAPLSVHARISLKHNSRPSHGHPSNHCTAHRRVSYPFCDLFHDWMCARKDLAASAPFTRGLEGSCPHSLYNKPASGPKPYNSW